MATALRDFEALPALPGGDESAPCEARPWGTVAPLAAGGHYRIRRLVVNPGESLGYALHRHRTEQWLVESGTGRVTRDEAMFTVAANDSVFIPARAPHRLENVGASPLCVIEVQVGARLDDADG